MNTSATRFVQLTSLDFDQSGQIAGASIQVRVLSVTTHDTLLKKFGLNIEAVTIFSSQICGIERIALVISAFVPVSLHSGRL